MNKYLSNDRVRMQLRLNSNLHSIKPFHFLMSEATTQFILAKESKESEKVSMYNIVDFMLSFLL